MSDKTIPTPTTSPEPPNREKLLDLSLPSILAGAAASMTVAVLSARLGVAGTVAGAALASIAFALVNAVYAASLKRTHHGLTLIVARRAPEVETADSPRRRALALAGVTVAAVTTFGVTLAGLAGFEASTGRTVADAPVTTIIRVVEVETTRAAARGASPDRHRRGELQHSRGPAGRRHGHATSAQRPDHERPGHDVPGVDRPGSADHECAERCRDGGASRVSPRPREAERGGGRPSARALTRRRRPDVRPQSSAFTRKCAARST